MTRRVALAFCSLALLLGSAAACDDEPGEDVVGDGEILDEE